jgi:hypothetical protein
MMTLLRGLHSIAAQHGDGLRPEFLRIITPSPACARVERLGSVAIVGDTRAKPVDEMERHTRSAEVVAAPLQKRG